MAEPSLPKKPTTAKPATARARRAAIQARRALMAREAKRAGSFAMIQPQRAKVTSAALHHIGQTQPQRPTDKPWQSRAYELVDGVGELGYLLNTKANMVADCHLLPQGLDEDGDWTLTEDDTEAGAAVVRTLAALVGPQGGQRELKRRAALHLSTGGETHLLGQVPEEEGDVGIVWEFLSTDELREEGHRFIRIRDGFEREELPAEHYLARCWRSHARFSGLADSELRRVIPIAEEVLVLTQLVDAIAKSRLSAGILYVPEEISFAGEDDEAGDDDEEADGADSFTKRLMEHLSAPIEDRTSAAALVPLIMRGPAELADKVVLIDLARQLDTWAQDLRQEALHRLATGLDSPPEIMTGKATLAGLGGGNVAISIDNEFVSRHIIPLGELIADFLTFAYLRPMLETFEGFTPQQAMLYRITFDPSPVQEVAGLGKAAQELHDSAPDIVSHDTARKANGMDDSDRPDDEEVKIRRTWELLKADPKVYGPALLPMLPGFETVDVALLEAGAAASAASPPAGSDVVGTLLPKPSVDGALPATASLRLALAVASDAMIERAVDRAATMVCSRKGKLADTEVRAALAAASKARVLQLVAPAHLKEMGLTPDALLAGAWEPLADRARTWTKVHLVEQGLDAATADDFAAIVAGRLAAGLQEWTTSRLHDGFANRHQGFRMPIGIVDAALAALDDAPQPVAV